MGRFEAFAVEAKKSPLKDRHDYVRPLKANCNFVILQIYSAFEALHTPQVSSL